MREEYNIPLIEVASYGITPAHAGRMLGLRRILAVTEDHPRACGKNFESAAYVARYVGSPPRMREEFSAFFVLPFSSGITPAHAGRIRTWYCRRSTQWDHPRACGKNPTPKIFLILIPGSPPRMREELYSFWK